MPRRSHEYVRVFGITVVPCTETYRESRTCEETVVHTGVRTLGERRDVDGVVVAIATVDAPAVVGGARMMWV